MRSPQWLISAQSFILTLCITYLSSISLNVLSYAIIQVSITIHGVLVVQDLYDTKM